ncbi:MAG TPA: DUF4368 domain-containing protein [Candidatus Caccalectryoclostridium excrementigallinarum]|uniref:DUF4368 domain-containing protein n=1 Tax=Candidatus Caccalectryoclostridium excrementigallinarum TaxID=2840710 RepID=A0A9D1SK18_9FIRM|nr:DUF4368 domain-containing protein [Candidatus Caccalectryoclostridium excrementigallinarum]
MEQKKVTMDYKVLTEKISPDNVAVMAELIAMKETKILISYLENEITELEERLTETTNTIQSADDFIRNIKKYLEAPELTREMCYELIDRIIVGGHPKHTGKEREIDIVYKVDIASVLRHKLKK